ncbi:MAG: hypothetical protein ACREFW_03065 [Rhizomicrobium sp.]
MQASLDRPRLHRRLVRYRHYADQALGEAARTSVADVRRVFLAMAAQWRTLAEQIEQEMRQREDGAA